MLLHFAYGSNMSGGPMRQRCPSARPLGTALLRDHRFVIMANGYASVAPAPGEEVHGVLWRIAPRDLTALDAYEDVAGGLYRQARLPVWYDGRTCEALVYIGNEKREGHPRPAYIRLIIAAAREHGLPENYVAGFSRWLSQGPRLIGAAQ